MTTFTTEDREALEKGLEFFASIKQTSPPHIIDSGASVMPKMNNEPVAWIKKKEIGYMEVTKKCGAKDYATNLGLVPEDDDIPLYTHPAKELHLSLQKSKQTGELLAVTYTDDEHRIVEVLWQRPPVKELTDEEINWLAKAYSTIEGELNAPAFARAILRKASE